MPEQDDLFGTQAEPALPTGLRFADGIIDAAEERALVERLATLTLEPFRFQGWLGKRHTASFGWHYDFDDARFAQTTPLPDFLGELRRRAAAFAGVDAGALVHALVTRYDPGAGIGWHRDRPVFDHVVGVSLQSPATLRLRRRKAAAAGGGFDRAALPLPPRSVYALDGEARYEWEHSIAPGEVRRWSVTFRTLAA
ncbi:MAG TPA: alpha-ketoglutarate-dependent dioxygenase AlkB [Sphingomonadaceae bacterium]|nr:alpha-ketoglutarate-dependent dioxygenase AlkB [Sphingomonadaceae bacterium]